MDGNAVARGGKHLADVRQVDAEHRRALCPAPGMDDQRPHPVGPLDEFAQECAPFTQVVPGPGSCPGQIKLAEFPPTFAELHEFAEQVKRGDPGRLQRRVQRGGVAVELCPGLFQAWHQGFEFLAARATQLPRAPDLLQHGALVGLVAVEFQAEGTQPGGFQAAFDHLQGRELLGHEEHGLAVERGGDDQVGDALAFAGAGRSLDDDVAAPAHHFNGLGLRAVRVHDVVEPRRRDEFIQVHVLSEGVVRGRKAVAQQARERRMIDELGGVRPRARVEVAVHQELGEGKEAECHRVRLHLPARLSGHGGGESLRITGGYQFLVFTRREPGQVQAELAFELGGQGKVLLHLALIPRQREPLAGVAAAQLHGHQQQRRVARGVRRVGLEPLQAAQGEVEDVDALLLQHELRVAVQVQEPPLEALGCQGGLELGIDVAARFARGRVDLVVFRLGKGKLPLVLVTRLVEADLCRGFIPTGGGGNRWFLSRPGKKVMALRSATSRRKTGSLFSSRTWMTRADLDSVGIESSRLRVERSRSSRRLSSSRAAMEGMGGKRRAALGTVRAVPGRLKTQGERRDAEWCQT